MLNHGTLSLQRTSWQLEQTGSPLSIAQAFQSKLLGTGLIEGLLNEHQDRADMRRDVGFPTGRHQRASKDCNVCATLHWVLPRHGFTSLSSRLYVLLVMGTLQLLLEWIVDSRSVRAKRLFDDGECEIRIGMHQAEMVDGRDLNEMLCVWLGKFQQCWRESRYQHDEMCMLPRQ